MSRTETGAMWPIVISRAGSDGQTEAFQVENAAAYPTAFVLTDEQAEGVVKFLRGRASIGRLAAAWGGWIAFALSVI